MHSILAAFDSLSDGVSLIGNDIRQRKGSQHSFVNRIGLLPTPPSFHGNGKMLTGSKSEADHGVSQVVLIGKWHDDKVQTANLTEPEFSRFPSREMGSTAFVLKVAEVRDARDIPIVT